jgi:DNA-binding LacI/PurR family transcriptional regulator
LSTIKDVSKHSGLSLATISKYLNGGNVRQANQRKIDEAIEALGYRINRNARSLKTNRTMTVGVVMPTLCVPFFGDVLSSLDKTLREAGYTSFVCSYEFDRDLELEKLRILCNNNVDGIVLVAHHVSAEELNEIRSSRGTEMPMVLVDRTIPDFRCDSIVIDNLNATYGAVEQLINAGHRRIGIIVGPLDISTANERMVGYRRVLEDYGIKLETGAGADGEEDAANGMIQIGRYDFESGYRKFNQFMDMENPPTALCVTNYDMTLGAATAAHERNIVLGRDIGFVGFDAVDLCRIVTPPLSIVEQPTFLMGQKAGELLLRRMAGESSPHPQVMRLKSHLHKRS